MESDFQTAFMLLGIGMVTVFTILGFVVATGKLLIHISNSLVKSKIVASQSHVLPQDPISSTQIAAITAAVHQLSGGQETIQKIEKIESD